MPFSCLGRNPGCFLQACVHGKSPGHGSDILKRLFLIDFSASGVQPARADRQRGSRSRAMLEKRGRKYHQNRVAETLRDEIGAMIEGQLSDPRISFAYVSQVVMNPGAKSAIIYVAVDGGLKEEADTLEGLMAARGFIRHELLERMG